MIDIIGLVGTILIVISFCFKNQIIIRAINITGSALFVIYGYCVNATFTWIANVILVLINLFYIFKLKKEEEK